MFWLNKFNKQLNYFCLVNDVFTKDEIEQIYALEDLQSFSRGKVGSDSDPSGEVKEEQRTSDIMWIYQDNRSNWLFYKFGALVSNVNTDHFMYDIEGFDNFQYTRYREGEFYNWHLDINPAYSNYERKISASIILSDPEEYEGGEFQIIYNGRVDEPVSLKPNKGDVIFFASWMPHRVAPIISGVRKSLVCWINGKRLS